MVKVMLSLLPPHTQRQPELSKFTDGAHLRKMAPLISHYSIQNHYGQWLQPWNWKTLVPWGKSYDKPRQCILKQGQRFADKGPYSQAMVFPVVMYRCEKNYIKKAECPRIDAFKLWCWRRLLRVPWTARKSNQSILKETNLEYSLEELMPKLHYFGHLMRRDDSLEKTMMLGNNEGKRRSGNTGWDGWMASLTEWTWVWTHSRR